MGTATLTNADAVALSRLSNNDAYLIAKKVESGEVNEKSRSISKRILVVEKAAKKGDRREFIHVDGDSIVVLLDTPGFLQELLRGPSSDLGGSWRWRKQG